MTADAVQRLVRAPATALVLAATPGEVPFGAEYAVLLAVAGSDVTLATPNPALIAGLDAALRPAVDEGLAALGIRVLTGCRVAGATKDAVRLQTNGGEVEVAAEVAVVADPRRPFTAGLALERAGVFANGSIPVDRGCRTNVSHIFAAGDVTGGAMLTNVASHMGDVAGTNAAGGETFTRTPAVPRLVHTVSECAWVGIDEATAGEQGYDVSVGMADLAFNARAVALGARTGGVKVIAEREMGQVLGVHVAGPGAGEVVALGALAMQAELPLAELAGMVQWHPTIGESLAEAARRAM
jgi:dihydrolipoamide dehydrogenase